MIRYTNEFLTDGDITIERVANRLKLISEGIKNSNKLNLCDINVICEEIFGKTNRMSMGAVLAVFWK